MFLLDVLSCDPLSESKMKLEQQWDSLPLTVSGNGIVIFKLEKDSGLPGFYPEFWQFHSWNRAVA